MLEARVLFATLSCALVVASAAPTIAQEVESYVDVVEGVEPTALAYGSITTNASISPATDIDTYVFDGRQGQLLRIVLRGWSNDFDPKFVLYDPSLQVVTGTGGSCAAPWNGTCAAVAARTLPMDGTYVLVVSDDDNFNAGSYTLHLESAVRSVSNVIPCNATTVDQIQVSTDVDVYDFHGETGSLIQVNVQGLSNDFDPRVDLFDPSWASLSISPASCASPWNGICSFSFTTTLATSGVHHLRIGDDDAFNAGWYQFTVQFLFPSCPEQPEFTSYCFGDGTGASCPCGTTQNGGLGSGCANSTGSGGLLAGSGTASVTADTVSLTASGTPNGTVSLFFQGTGPRAAGFGSRYGDGLLCVQGTIVRLGVRRIFGAYAFGTGTPGDPLVSTAGSVPGTGATRYYQVWYRNSADYCTPSTFNLTNGVRLAWRP